MEPDDDDVIEECESGCGEAGYAFASLAALAPPMPWPSAPWRPTDQER